ncbi:MAG: hypothetical protein AUJ75_04135 [Candidatus Omnitrophica bacterium CG1_02_49_10]|nr:MAG: hypothetical protein AUJ75_04135 [Candidatus Omnitrophica bacterium CG1_02_49_10]
MGKSIDERRRYPRANASLSFKISGKKFDVITQTKNISGGGVYCQINKSIAPMSKVKLALFIPHKVTRKKGAARGNSNLALDRIICDGVVIRAEKAKDPVLFGAGNYNIAVYLTGVKEEERQSILGYVKESGEKKHTKKFD